MKFHKIISIFIYNVCLANSVCFLSSIYLLFKHFPEKCFVKTLHTMKLIEWVEHFEISEKTNERHATISKRPLRLIDLRDNGETNRIE